MDYLKSNHLSILIIVFLVLSHLFGGTAPLEGAVTSANQTTITNPFNFTKAVTFTSSITQSTTNAATSTLSVGCVQTVATSTATPIKIIFNQQGTTTALFSATVQGSVLWAFGSCP